jgi:TRAP-type C4-dicarboxylate transport system permease small subunit
MEERIDDAKLARGTLIPEGWLNRICSWWAIPSGVVLVLVMLVTTSDVLMRRIINNPIAEAYDIAILGLLVSTFCALAWVLTIGGHIEADVLFRKYPPRLQKVVNSAALFLSIFPAVAIAWGALIWAQSMIRVGQVTLVLRWPLAPFVIVEIIGAALLALAVVVKTVNSLRMGRD